MSRGFTLVEALVAFAILSVGLLGAATLVLSGLRQQSLALRRGAAATLLADMASRIRANPTAGPAYDSRAGSSEVTACDTAAPCTPAALAAHDRAHFSAAALALLPQRQPRAEIVFEPAIGSAAADRYLLSISWKEARDPDVVDEATLILLAPPVAGAP